MSDLIRFASVEWTVSGLDSRAFSFGDLEERRWLWYAFDLFIFPFAVIFTRFANPLCVFTFGI
jgi:hypothetical protein